MINELKQKLESLKAERKLIIEPYDKSIKELTQAIEKLETVNNKITEIKTNVSVSKQEKVKE